MIIYYRRSKSKSKINKKIKYTKKNKLNNSVNVKVLRIIIKCNKIKV